MVIKIKTNPSSKEPVILQSLDQKGVELVLRKKYNNVITELPRGYTVLIIPEKSEISINDEPLTSGTPLDYAPYLADWKIASATGEVIFKQNEKGEQKWEQ